MSSHRRNHAHCAGAYRGAFALPGTQRKYERSLPFSFSHIELELKLTPEKTEILGVATIHFERAASHAKELSLDAVCFDIKKVELDSGKGFKPARFDYDDAILKVHVGGRGGAGKLRIQYRAKPERGLYFLKPDDKVKQRPLQVWSQCQDEDARHWFPCHDKPHVKTTVDFKVTVPTRFQVLCNGDLVSGNLSSKRNAKSKTHSFKYQMKSPIPSYLVTLVVGEFDVIEDRPAKLTSGREVPISYWVPKGRKADGNRAFKGTPRMIELFSSLTGVDYPFPKYTQVVVSDFTFGGMENTTATTMYEHILLDERASLDIESEDLVAHELAHQWFGDWVTCKDWPHAWLNEGFATYFEHVEAEHRVDHDEYLSGIERDLRNYLGEVNSRYSRAIVSRDYEEPIDLFDRHLYEQGGLVLHMLRQKLGDKRFWAGVKAYLSAHGNGHATTEDLRAAFESAAGQSLERFFDEWVMRPGHPSLKAKIVWEAPELRVSLQQLQKAFNFELEIEVEVMLENGNVQSHTHVMSAKHDAIVLNLQHRPEYVAIDPKLKIAGELSVECPVALSRRQLVKGSSPRIKRQALKQLRGKTDFKTLEALAHCLSKPKEHWTVRAAAAQALGRIGSVDALDRIEAVLPIEHHKLRAAIYEALGEFQNKRAVKLLQAALKGEQSYLVEAAILRALGKTGVPSVATKLKAGLKKQSWAEVIACASADALAALEDEQHYPVLKALTEYGTPMPSRRAAITALAKLGKPDEVRKHLGKLLKDEHPHVRLSVVSALEEVGDSKAAGLLRAHLRRETDGRVRRRTNEALRKLSSGGGQRELTQKLSRLERALSEIEAKVAMLEAK